MNVDLDRKIRALMQQVVDQSPTPPLVSIEETTPARPAFTPRRRHLAIAGVAAAIVVVLIGAIVILDPFASDGVRYVEEPTTVPTTAVPVAPTTTEPAQTVSTTTATTTAIPSSAFEWERISDPVVEEGGLIRAIIHHNDRYLAVGTFQGDGNGALWRSLDGRTWTRDLAPALAGVELVEVVPYRDGLVAVGNTPFDFESEEDPEPVVLVSEDGSSWERADTSDPEIFVPAEMDWRGPLKSVAVLGDRIIMVGTHIWVSDNARTWTLAVNLEDEAWALDVTAGEAGFVVVGSAFPSAKAWHSTDGDQWTETRVTTPGRLVSSMNTVLATPQGYVAGGGVGAANDMGMTPEGGAVATDAAVWVSSDGITWTSVLEDPEHLGGPYGQAISSIADTGELLVAVGTELYNNWNSATGVIWESEDAGLTWKRVADPDHLLGNVFEGWAEINHVVFHDGRLVAVGYIEENKYLPGIAGVWLGTPSG